MRHISRSHRRGQKTYICIKAGANYTAGSAAGVTINDLHDAAMTVDGWFKCVNNGVVQVLTNKGTYTTNGWFLRVEGNGTITAKVQCVTTSPAATSTNRYDDNRWHYIAFTFNDAGDRKVYLYIDAVLVATSGAASGAIVSDAASGGGLSKSSNPLTEHGWLRWSNAVRTITLLSRYLPPAVDANTVAQWNVDEGNGALFNDETANDNHCHLAGTYSWIKD